VLCPFERTPIGGVLVVFAGGDGDWVDGAVWRGGTGAVARSSGAWTCWIRRMNCCNPTNRSASAVSSLIGSSSAHHFVGEERTC
jgi:hypothetical protein